MSTPRPPRISADLTASRRSPLHSAASRRPSIPKRGVARTGTGHSSVCSSPSPSRPSSRASPARQQTHHESLHPARTTRTGHGGGVRSRRRDSPLGRRQGSPQGCQSSFPEVSRLFSRVEDAEDSGRLPRQPYRLCTSSKFLEGSWLTAATQRCTRRDEHGSSRHASIGSLGQGG